MTIEVSLTPELERFASQCLQDGRYTDVSDVVRSALRLLQHREAGREQLERTLDRAAAEAYRDGVFSAESVLNEAEAIVRSASVYRDIEVMTQGRRAPLYRLLPCVPHFA